MKHSNRAFTLIEIMISIAILAILFTSLFVIAADMKWISHEADYFNAVRLMKLNDKLVKEKSFYSLPPEVRIISSDGRVSLANRFILPQSVVVMTSDNETLLPDDYGVDSRTGVVTFLPEKLVGKKVIVKYSYLIPDSGELCRIPEKSPYSVELMNNPISDVLMVERIDGNRKTLLGKSSYSFNPGGGSVSFDENIAGKVVEVRYIGKKILNICTGRFVSPGTLNESGEPTGMKLITIREVYGAGGNTIETVQVRKSDDG
ncbi:MAG: type II secretion system GspH family protein [Candidatus Eremiobacteraeota bacterium]|nr:type II secretion system GspH family protein [Candidatus Eremiobacteraeota bacterium]